MTREEAITYAKRAVELGLNDETQAFCDMAIKALEQQSSEDCISREKAIKQCGFGMTSLLIADCLLKLPSVTPQPKIGRWIEQEGFDGDEYYDCSECGESFCLRDGTPTDNMYNYCPNCGAKMREAKKNDIT